MLDHNQLIILLRKQVKEEGSQKAFALKYRVSQQYLSDVLKKRREPGAKILQALGYKRVVQYVKVYGMDESSVQSQR